MLIVNNKYGIMVMYVNKRPVVNEYMSYLFEREQTLQTRI